MFLSILTLIISIVALVVSIAVVFSLKFQKKQEKKYQEVLDIVNKNKDKTFEVKNYLTDEDINKIDSTIDVSKLSQELYDTFLRFEKNIRELDSNFDGILTGFLKEFYLEKIDSFKKDNYYSVTDKINLIGYSIVSFNSDELKFRINISCVSYKKKNGKLISGSEASLAEQIILLSFKKDNNIWLISGYDKIFEKKLSE